MNSPLEPTSTLRNASETPSAPGKPDVRSKGRTAQAVEEKVTAEAEAEVVAMVVVGKARMLGTSCELKELRSGAFWLSISLPHQTTELPSVGLPTNCGERS